MKKKIPDKTQKGWTTIEFLIAFPLLFATFLMILHYGLLLKTKLALTNASHTAVQALAKTGSCSKATEYFKANFDQPSGASISCSGGTEKVSVEAKFNYPPENFFFIVIPNQPLKVKAVAYSEKE